MDDWQGQQQYPRSHSVHIPASQLSQVQHDQHYYDYDRRPPNQLPPLQLNPAFQGEPPRNVPSSSLPPHPRDRHRTQSVALTSIGQREPYPSSSYARPPNYPPEATVPISGRSRHQQHWVPYHDVPHDQQQPHVQVPYISSVMTPYPQMSRQMPPLHELDRRQGPVPSASDDVPQQAQPRAKPHACDQCGAAFSRAHDLKRHIETHKGDRPHKCPTCVKAFSRKDALQRHQSMAQCGVEY